MYGIIFDRGNEFHRELRNPRARFLVITELICVRLDDDSVEGRPRRRAHITLVTTFREGEVPETHHSGEPTPCDGSCRDQFVLPSNTRQVVRRYLEADQERLPLAEAR